MPLDISTRRVTPRIGIFPHTIICRSWGAGDRSRWVGGALAGALLGRKIGGFPEFAARDYGRERGNPRQSRFESKVRDAVAVPIRQEGLAIEEKPQMTYRIEGLRHDQ